MDALDSFTEISASGKGLHVLCWGAIPSNLNRQKVNGELWDSNKMFCFTGIIYEGGDKIEARDMVPLYKRISAGKFGPEYKPLIIPEPYDSQKFKDVCADNWAGYFDSRSSAVHSALCTLALKHKHDEEKIREEFEKTAICEAWEEKGKWTRLADREIARAIEFVKKSAGKTNGKAVEVFELTGPAVKGSDFDFVVNPMSGNCDGWFPRGDVSLIAAMSMEARRL